MQGFLIVFLGAGLGGALRHAVNLMAARLLGVSFPFGTLTVNLLGSLAMGLLIAWFSRRGPGGDQLRLLLATGVLGGFTTFSSFALDTVGLIEAGTPKLALLYVAASVLLSIAALTVGLILFRPPVLNG